MNVYKLIIAYDGTEYYGWQQQQNKATIAGTLEACFKKVFKISCSVLGASRTDAGVHALGHVARLATALTLDPAALQRALNGALPSAIHVRSVANVPEDFNPFHDIAYKLYYYHIFTQRPLPLWSRYGYYYPHLLDSTRLQEALAVFVGTHDFRSFCTGEYLSTVRTIDAITVVFDRRVRAYRVMVRGKGFLRYMIRRIVGAALYSAAVPECTVAVLQGIFAEKNPRQQLFIAPAKGLVLRKIVYET